MTLAELRALALAATPGPWRNKPSHHGRRYRFVQFGSDDLYSTADILPPDAKLIAALSPERVLALIACVEAADAMRDRWPLEPNSSERAYDASRAKLDDGSEPPPR